MSNTRLVITSGKPYLDIDAYGGIIAYAELLRAQGQDAKAVSTSILNESIPSQLRNLKADFHTSLTPSPKNRFAVLDTSDPKHFDDIVQLDQVLEVIDHHPGHESYWAARPEVATDIELFGAVCTLICERWQEAGLLPQLSLNAAVLLASGILDNTLNFGASVATDADKTAYAALARHAGLSATWPEEYFTACENAILHDLPTAIINDLKILTFQSFGGTVGVGQLVVWDADIILKSHARTIAATLEPRSPHWFMNLISLRHHSNRLLTDDPATRTWLTNLLGVTFQGNVGVTARPWLRKEIMKQDLNSPDS